MSKTQMILIVVTILLLIMGLWPIALLTIGGIIAIAIHNHENSRKAEKEDLEKLKKKIEALEREKYIESLVNGDNKKE